MNRFIIQQLAPFRICLETCKQLEGLKKDKPLLDNLRYIKDAHRNPIAHARGDYDETKAVAVFSDVKRFMERLSTRVSG
jgi:hypothetical protein